MSKGLNVEEFKKVFETDATRRNEVQAKTIHEQNLRIKELEEKLKEKDQLIKSLQRQLKWKDDA